MRTRVPLGVRDVIVLIRGGGRTRESRAFAILDELVEKKFPCVPVGAVPAVVKGAIRGDPRVNLVSLGVNPVVNW